MTRLQSVGVLLCGLHGARRRREGLEARVSPDRFGLFLTLRHGLRRWERIGGGMIYLVRIFGAADWHGCGSVGGVWLVLVDDDGVVFAALLGQWSGDAVAAARVFR